MFGYRPRAVGALFLVAFLVAALGYSAAAAADRVTAVEAAAALSTRGYVASIDRDAHGDPLVRVSGPETAFSVLFYGCDEARVRCTSIEFAAHYREFAGKVTLADMNE